MILEIGDKVSLEFADRLQDYTVDSYECSNPKGIVSPDGIIRDYVLIHLRSTGSPYYVVKETKPSRIPIPSIPEETCPSHWCG